MKTLPKLFRIQMTQAIFLWVLWDRDYMSLKTINFINSIHGTTVVLPAYLTTVNMRKTIMFA